MAAWAATPGACRARKSCSPWKSGASN
jgi:hypothetical protein